MPRRLLRNRGTYIFLAVGCVLAIVLVFSDLGAGVNPEGNTHNLPLVIANEDAGAQINGQQTNIGAQTVARVTAPDPQRGDSVKWTVVSSRQEAVNRIRDNKAYGALVIPQDFTARLAALSSQGGPPAGAQQGGAPAGAGQQGGAPSGAAQGGAPSGSGQQGGAPAGTAQAGAPAGAAQQGGAPPAGAQQGASPAAGGQQGAPAGAAQQGGAPAGAAQGGAAAGGQQGGGQQGGAQQGGPQAAQIEVLTNPGAGIVPKSASEEILNQIAAGISKGASDQALAALNASGARIPGSAAALVANPVHSTTTAAAPIGSHSGLGLTPFFVGLMVVLVGFLGVIVVSQGVDTVVAREGLVLSALELWGAKLVFTLALAVLAGILQTLVAVGVLGMDAPNSVSLALFIMLGTAVMALITLFFVTVLGEAGLLPASLLTLVLGPPSSGGINPLEMLPGFYRFLAAFLPMRYVVDGVRGLLFFGGRLSAGLGAALWVLIVYVVLMIALGAAAAVALDRRKAGRQAPAAPAVPPPPAVEPPEAAPAPSAG